MVIPPSLSRSELKDKKDGVASQTMAEQEDEEKDKPVSHGGEENSFYSELCIVYENATVSLLLLGTPA